MTPLESTYKQCVGRQNVGPPQSSAVLMSPMFGRKSEDTQTHICITNSLLYFANSPTIYICITNNLLYFTTSLTIYFTLLHSLKTQLFIKLVLNNPNLTRSLSGLHRGGELSPRLRMQSFGCKEGLSKDPRSA